jgi:uncharacterized protein DUF3891
MVLYPLKTFIDSAISRFGPGTPAAHSGQIDRKVVSAWEAVEKKQKQKADAWWLVAQPDHAALAGDLAASISCSYFPRLEPDVLEAITLHDAGWAQFDRPHEPVASLTSRENSPTAKASDSGRPPSFLDMSPTDFIRAWSDSIERAQQSSPTGGLLVSQHFSRLAENRLAMRADSPADIDKLKTFLAGEAARQCRLGARAGRHAEQVHVLVDVLQFCDLLSLYLCCGAREDAVLPQRFQGQSILLRRDGEMCRTEPAIFGKGVSLGVSARRHPALREEANVVSLGFLLE